jgi:hypothetical protein
LIGITIGHDRKDMRKVWKIYINNLFSSIYFQEQVGF